MRKRNFSYGTRQSDAKPRREPLLFAPPPAALDTADTTIEDDPSPNDSMESGTQPEHAAPLPSGEAAFPTYLYLPEPADRGHRVPSLWLGGFIGAVIVIGVAGGYAWHAYDVLPGAAPSLDLGPMASAPAAVPSDGDVAAPSDPTPAASLFAQGPSANTAPAVHEPPTHKLPTHKLAAHALPTHKVADHQPVVPETVASSAPPEAIEKPRVPTKRMVAEPHKRGPAPSMIARQDYRGAMADVASAWPAAPRVLPAPAASSALASSAAAPLPAPVETVTIDGVTYVAGQEPHSLGTIKESALPSSNPSSGADSGG